jgi:hypothetical protein
MAAEAAVRLALSLDPPGKRALPVDPTRIVCCVLIAIIAWLGALLRPAAATLVINEVCYDPPGPDSGAEFVELINTGDQILDLAGHRLEFGNGSVGPVWAVRWTGQAGDRIAPGGLFLVVDRGWDGPPADAEVSLGLQNGPDALRLVRTDGSVDLVGWGDLDWPEMSAGTPHPGAPGLALARRPDGHDTGDNAADFVAATPTPGQRNWAEYSVTRQELEWRPPSLTAADHPLTVQVRLRNTGLRDLIGSTVDLRVGTARMTAFLDGPPVDQDTTLILTITPRETGQLSADLFLQGTRPADTCRVDLGRVQVGPSAIRLSEVMPAPNDGGEWCELVNLGSVPRNLADLALRDEDGSWRPLPDQVLAPGDCLLIAQDAAALTGWLQDLASAGARLTCEPRPPLQLDGWPILNNSAPAGRDFADRLYLGDRDGTVLDHVTMGLGNGRVPVGRSYERQPDLAWRPSTAVIGSTPGCLPPVAPPVAAGDLKIAPNPFSWREGDGALRIHLTVPDDAGGWSLRIFDLWGRLVRDLGGDDLGPGPRQVAWDASDEDGRSLSPGGYVAVLYWRRAAGSLTAATRRLVVIREARP